MAYDVDALEGWMTRQEAAVETLRRQQEHLLHELSARLDCFMARQDSVLDRLQVSSDLEPPSSIVACSTVSPNSPASILDVDSPMSRRARSPRRAECGPPCYPPHAGGAAAPVPGPLQLAHAPAPPEEQKPQVASRSNSGSLDTSSSRSSSMAAVRGCRARLRMFCKSNRFDHLVAVLLISNAAFIGVQVQYMFELEKPFAIDIVDYVYSVCFVVELLVRIYAFGLWVFMTDPDNLGWNWFDLIVVGFSTADTAVSLLLTESETPLKSISILRIVRIVRITRVLRIIRVMRFFKHLRMLIAAITTTLKTAMWTLMMLFMILYIFGIAVAQTSAEFVVGQNLPPDDPVQKYFGSLPMTIMTLFMSVCGGIDWETAWTPLYKMSPATSALYIFFIVFVTLVVLNVMTGIFCESAIDAAQSDKEHVICCQLKDAERYVAELQALFRGWDTSGDGNVTLEEFQAQLEDKRVMALFRSLDIEAEDATEFFKMLDQDGGGSVDLSEFIAGCIRLRGGAKAVQLARLEMNGQLLQKKVSQLDEVISNLQVIAAHQGRSSGRAAKPRTAEKAGAASRDACIELREEDAELLRDSGFFEVRLNGCPSYLPGDPQLIEEDV
eukprot:TRINITY_DN1284_c0_g2_i2.p1 TRINITY_DN1284_c0_g2~~TRINITY_DN1284_c0_g2_i2.p1  ORF type:complete len:682 (-),score=158.23 TRINITY_DN1284_c0_g2_i2:87-1919(-)